MRGMELTGKAETTQTRRYASGQAAAQGHTQQSLPTTFLPTPPGSQRQQSRHESPGGGHRLYSSRTAARHLSWL